MAVENAWNGENGAAKAILKASSLTFPSSKTAGNFLFDSSDLSSNGEDGGAAECVDPISCSRVVDATASPANGLSIVTVVLLLVCDGALSWPSRFFFAAVPTS